MIRKTVTIEYKEYSSAEELPSDDKALLEAAIAAVKGSYAPYSQFNVGAAVRMSDGVVVKGANQENAAFPSGMCAERTALYAASAQYPESRIQAMAIVASVNGEIQASPTYPCGACRQVMAQYELKSGTKMHIIVGSRKKVEVFDGVSSLMPFIFDDI